MDEYNKANKNRNVDKINFALKSKRLDVILFNRNAKMFKVQHDSVLERFK
jgi:hypothetical protein